jgi:hypothetical protein
LSMENSALRQSGRGPQTNWMCTWLVGITWPCRFDEREAQQKLKSIESSTSKLTETYNRVLRACSMEAHKALFNDNDHNSISVIQ